MYLFNPIIFTMGVTWKGGFPRNIEVIPLKMCTIPSEGFYPLDKLFRVSAIFVDNRMRRFLRFNV